MAAEHQLGSPAVMGTILKVSSSSFCIWSWRTALVFFWFKRLVPLGWLKRAVNYSPILMSATSYMQTSCRMVWLMDCKTNDETYKVPFS